QPTHRPYGDLVLQELTVYGGASTRPPAQPSDAVKRVELGSGRLETEDRQRETLIEGVEARQAPKAREKLARDLVLHLPVPIQELAPERHMAKSTADHLGGREIRLRKQAPVRVEVVEPRSPATRGACSVVRLRCAKSAARSASRCPLCSAASGD